MPNDNSTKHDSTRDDNVALVRRWFDEVWNQRRAETIEELLDRESRCHADDDLLTGRAEFIERMYRPFTAAFPDLRLEIEGIVGDGGQVVVRWRATGTHVGEGLGFPPTGRTGRFHGMTWINLRDGKLVQGWQRSNIPEVLRGLAGGAG